MHIYVNICARTYEICTYIYTDVPLINQHILNVCIFIIIQIDVAKLPAPTFLRAEMAEELGIHAACGLPFFTGQSQ